MNMVRRILDLILPSSCAYCNSSVSGSGVPFFCSSCWSDFTVMTGALCPVCGRQFESPEALTYSADHCCLSCKQRPPAFDQSLSVGYFEGPLREAIHQFKYRPCRALGRPLASWMIRNIRPVSNVDCIMPVPLHITRLRQRGFNQALIIANELSNAFSIPLSYDNLIRARPTRPQVELSVRERVTNVAGAFILKKPAVCANKTVLLVDDVYTTGATMNECARVLINAGASGVNALTIARAA